MSTPSYFIQAYLVLLEGILPNRHDVEDEAGHMHLTSSYQII